jgi:hypothetical protein
MAALDGAPVGHRHPDTRVGAGDRIGTRVLDQRDAAFGEHVLQHGRGVGVLVRQDLIAAGHHGHRDTELGVSVDELGAGDAGADHDEVLGQSLQIVELTPVEDAFAVRRGVGQHPRARACGDQHHVGRQLTHPPVEPGDLDAVLRHARTIVDQLAAALDQVDAFVAQPLGDVGGLRRGQGLHPLVDLR